MFARLRGTATGGSRPVTEPDDPSALKDLDARLKAAQARRDAERDRTGPGDGRAAASGMGLGFRIAMDILAALVVGVVLGLLLDKWLGTLPLFLVVLFFMGGAAGILNAYRTASGQGYAVGHRKADDADRGSEDQGKEDQR